jgi:pilus assembly protein Flp/PilA
MTLALVKLQTRLRTVKNEEGATAVEYGLMVALIAAVIIAVVAILGGKISSVFSEVAGAV